MVAPYEDSDMVTLIRRGKTFINTFSGAYLLKQRNKEPMRNHLVLHTLQSVKENDTWKNEKKPLHKLTQDEDKDVIVMVEQNGVAKIVARAQPKSTIQEKNAVNKSPEEILFDAIRADSKEGIQKAIATGAHIHRMKEGKPPILWATLLNRANAVKGLLAAGAQPTDEMVGYAVKLRNIRLAYMLAQKAGVEVWSASYESSARKNVNDKSLGRAQLFQHAVIYQDFELALKILKTQKPQYKCVSDHVVSYIVEGVTEPSSKNLALDLLQEILTRGYDVNNMWTLRKGDPYCHGRQEDAVYHQDCVKLLLAKGANHDLIIDMNPQPNQHSAKWTPLFRAIECNKRESCKLLLDAGADVNKKAKSATNQDMFTPLSYALEKANNEIVELLLEYGAQL
jgi:ankyrin repeat protein